MNEANDEVVGFVVQDRITQRLIHYEYFESAGTSAEKLANMMANRVEKLYRKYSPNDYIVEHGVFNSKSAFHHYFPDTRSGSSSPKPNS